MAVLLTLTPETFPWMSIEASMLLTELKSLEFTCEMADVISFLFIEPYPTTTTSSSAVVSVSSTTLILPPLT